MAVAQYVLFTDEHPAADEVLERVRQQLPMISRATVYNTLNLLVQKGLLQELALTEGRVVFDPNMASHHHFIDEQTGEIRDVPWEKLRVTGLTGLEDDLEVREYQVVLRGRRRREA